MQNRYMHKALIFSFSTFRYVRSSVYTVVSKFSNTQQIHNRLNCIKLQLYIFIFIHTLNRANYCMHIYLLIQAFSCATFRDGDISSVNQLVLLPAAQMFVILTLRSCCHATASIYKIAKNISWRGSIYACCPADYRTRYSMQVIRLRAFNNIILNQLGLEPRAVKTVKGLNGTYHIWHPKFPTGLTHHIYIRKYNLKIIKTTRFGIFSWTYNWPVGLWRYN
jgi:hypothetical protein